jgi:hypothetical protein
LGSLPAAFSSTGAVCNSDDIVEVLLREQAVHSDIEEHLLMSFPKGADYYLQKTLSEVVDYLLYQDELIFQTYTSRRIKALHAPNWVRGVWESHILREKGLARCEKSTVQSIEECVERLNEVVAFLGHSVDITESMKLPMRITSKLFSLMTVLLSIPLDDASMVPLNDLFLSHPQFVALEQWCGRMNDGCKLWSQVAMSWRKTIRSGESLPVACKKISAWYEWLGWKSKGESAQHKAAPEFVAEKSHNVLFAMTAVSALFVYYASLASSQ